MKEADIRLFRINGEKLENSISELATLTENALKDTEEGEKRLEELKKQADEIRITAENMSEQIDDMNRRIANLSGEIEKNSGIVTLTEEQIRNFEASVARLEGEKLAKENRINENSAEIDACIDSLKKSEEDIDVMKALLASKEESYNAMLEKLTEFEEKI